MLDLVNEETVFGESNKPTLRIGWITPKWRKLIAKDSLVGYVRDLNNIRVLYGPRKSDRHTPLA